MRIVSMALVWGLAAGCVAPAAVRDGLQHELEDLRLLEAQVLPLIPDGPPVDFGGGTSYRPRDGWRLQLRAMQLRAASLVAWAHDVVFDQEAAYQTLLMPALAEAKKNAEGE